MSNLQTTRKPHHLKLDSPFLIHLVVLCPAAAISWICRPSDCASLRTGRRAQNLTRPISFMYGSSPWTCGFARRTYIKAPCDNHVALYASADFLRLLRESTPSPKLIGIGLGPMLRSDTCLRIYALAVRSALVRKSPQSPQLSNGRASDGQRPCSIRSCQHSPAMAYSRQRH